MWVSIEMRKCEGCQENSPEARLKYVRDDGVVTLGDGAYCIKCAQDRADEFNRRIHGTSARPTT